MDFHHISVMPDECMEGLHIRPDGVYVDATTGGAGHSCLIAERLNASGRLICIDRDDDALREARIRLQGAAPRIDFVKSNFSCVGEVLHTLDIPAIDGILFDLGVSSYQLDEPERGFSFRYDAPLDMRMDRSERMSAFDVVNTYTEQRLRDVIGVYGEERYAGRIASAIVRARTDKPIERTTELAEIIRAAMPAAARREKQHPAKRTFQAIRIEVNGELAAVEKAMDDAINALAPGGRIAVISFHSLEDRIVKNAFAKAAAGCTCPREFPVCICGGKPKIKLVFRGVVTATEAELAHNPRSHSAKLRVAEKL